MGDICLITALWEDQTASIMFDDGMKFDLPFECIEKNIDLDASDDEPDKGYQMNQINEVDDNMEYSPMTGQPKKY